MLANFKNYFETISESEIATVKNDFINKLQEYRRWLDENIIYLKIQNNDLHEYAFRSDSDDEISAPNNSDAKAKLRQFQSMLYVSSSDSQEWVLKAYNNQTPVTLDMLKMLPKESAEIPELPDMRYPDIDRSWFWLLDYLLWEKFIEKPDDFASYNLTAEEKSAIIHYKFRRNRSIEHLHPQTDNNSWLDEDKDFFGNLAMISSSFNSRQQNDSVGVKFARLREEQIPERKLESIKLLLMFKSAQGRDENWSVAMSEKHGKAMYNILFPRELA